MPVHDVIINGMALAAKLREQPGRAVYESADGDFFVDYQGGRVARNAIREAFAADLIKLKWPGRPDLHHYILK